MKTSSSVQFFDSQFQPQVRHREFALNPFESVALPHLRGRVLDFRCGIRNLATAAAEQGCSVLALDASPAAIDHIRSTAAANKLSITAATADLRRYELEEDFDTIVSIGLLMFFDCPTAFRQLAQLQQHVRPGSVAVVNVPVEGTSTSTCSTRRATACSRATRCSAASPAGTCSTPSTGTLQQ